MVLHIKISINFWTITIHMYLYTCKNWMIIIVSNWNNYKTITAFFISQVDELCCVRTEHILTRFLARTSPVAFIFKESKRKSTLKKLIGTKIEHIPFWAAETVPTNNTTRNSFMPNFVDSTFAFIPLLSVFWDDQSL